MVPAAKARTQPSLDQTLQRGVVGIARLAHGAQDAALGVWRALQASGGLVGPIAREDGVRVAVDQPGRDEGGPKVDAVVVIRRGAGIADPRHAPVPHLYGPWGESRGRQAAGARQEHGSRGRGGR